MAKAKRTNKIRIGNKVMQFETDLFSPSGHTTYSGYGYHNDKNRSAERRAHKMEAKRVLKEEW